MDSPFTVDFILKFPNLFIVGAMKSGTSSLHCYLNQHPDIFMSGFKEPQYFAPHLTKEGLHWGQGNDSPSSGEGWYLDLFRNAGDVKYAGESSVSYTARPWVEGAERRIFSFNRFAKIIYLVKDPVERAISHYWHFVRDGREDRSPLLAFKKCGDYVARSSYLMQITPYVELFGADNVFILTSEYLSLHPTDAMKRIFTWLGLQANVEIDTSMRCNVTPEIVRKTRRGMAFMDSMLRDYSNRGFLSRLPICERMLNAITYTKVNRSELSMDQSKIFLKSKLFETSLKFVDRFNIDSRFWDSTFQ